MKHLEYFNVLRFLIGKKVSKASRDEVCADLGISQSTYYRLLEKIRKLPVASSLQPKKRGPKKGQPRLSDIQEELTRNFILREHLTKQKPRASKSYLRLIEEFDRLSVEVPSDRTFRRRLKSITKDQERNGRMYASERRSKHSPKTKHFQASAPMEVVQIDHTKLNAIAISNIDGEVLGRVIITVVEDIYTRLIVGFYLSLYGPDHECVSHALAHACYDKSEYLSKQGLKGNWVNLGLPDLIHMDNAKEFKSVALMHGCSEYGINVHYRPIRTPHFGGHVESAIRTLNDNLRNIPGATFANWQERGDYPSEKLACFTLPFLEKYVANHIANFYHKTTHSKLGVSPEQKYEEAVEQGFKPRLPPKTKGKFIADFSASYIRKVRDLGVEFECKEYWDPYLASLYNQNVSSVKVLPIEETVTAINVLGPDGELHRVPAKDLSLPDVTRREWRRYRRIVLERNNQTKMSNREIADYIREENQIQREAKRRSKFLRRADEYRSERKHSINDNQSLPPAHQGDQTKVSFDPGSAFNTEREG